MFVIRRFSAATALTLGLLLLGQGTALAEWKPDNTRDGQHEQRPKDEKSCDDAHRRPRETRYEKTTDCRDTCDVEKDTPRSGRTTRWQNEDDCQDPGDRHDRRDKDRDRYDRRDGKHYDKVDHHRRKADRQRDTADRWDKRRHESKSKARANWRKYHSWKGHDRDRAEIYRTKARRYDRRAERCAEKAGGWSDRADMSDRQAEQLAKLLSFLLHLLKTNGYGAA